MKLNQRVHLPSSTNARYHTGRLTGLTKATFTVSFDTRYAHVTKDRDVWYDFNRGGTKVKGWSQTYPIGQLVNFKQGNPGA